MLSLIYGGSGSGKSEFAENYVESLSSKNRIYIATMIPYGKESLKKIERHRIMREKRHFVTMECYTNLSGVSINENATVLLECISNLVANEMFQDSGAGVRTTEAVLEGVNHVLTQVEHLVIVTNDVFCDGVQYEQETKDYIKNIGLINQGLMELADEVVEVVYGIPVYYKQREEKRK